jgi:ABC-type transport system involved in multi-copper enzyme maturation permease subunit
MTMAGTTVPMKTACATIATLALWTIIDEFRQRSVLIFFAACAAFMFVTRGCFQGSYVVNGAALDAAPVVSQATFHVVAAGVMMLAALMAMRIFKREGDDGTQAYLLSRPIARSHYLAGKVAGLWLGSAASMLALHGVLCLMAFLNAHAAVIPGYLTASLLCSANLLLIVLAAMALSLWLPDFLAFLAILGVGVVSFIGHGLEAVAQNPMVQSAMQQSGAQGAHGFPWWKAAWILWPKLGGLQVVASSLIGRESFSTRALVSPLVNVAVFCCVLGTLCYIGFSREEIV